MTICVVKNLIDACITMVEYTGTATARAGTATVAVPAHFVADRICDCSSVVAVPAFDDM